MRTLPLTLLATPGPLGRAYMTSLRRAGCRVRDVCLAIVAGRSEPHDASALARALRMLVPQTFARAFERHRAEERGLYWPRRLRSARPQLYRAVVEALESRVPQATTLLAETLGSFDWSAYAHRMRVVHIDGLGDARLAEALAEETGAVLYAGSRIVPARLLKGAESTARRFLHIHPGRLPEVRGADGLLWSHLLGAGTGMSALYLDAGIDTGDVIATHDSAPLRLPTFQTAGLDWKDLYRALYSFVDPLLRASFLVEHVLPLGDDFAALPASPQDPAAGVRYGFMPEALARPLLERMFAVDAERSTNSLSEHA